MNRGNRGWSTLLAFGEPQGDTAMARTVSLPAAIAVKLILSGKITQPGVYAPLAADVYTPVLRELQQLGIEFTEKTRK